MLGTSMKELGCKRLISWKRGCKGDVPLPFAKKRTHVIWWSRTPQQALGRCQPDHRELSKKKMNRG